MIWSFYWGRKPLWAFQAEDLFDAYLRKSKVFSFAPITILDLSHDTESMRQIMKIVIIIIIMPSCCCIRVPTKIKLCGWSELIRATQVIIDQMIFSWGSSPRIKPPCFSLWQISPKLSPQQIYGNKYQTIIKIVKTTRNLVLMHFILCLRFRELAMSVLMREPLGSFMVRNSTSQPGTLALSVRYKWLWLDYDL